MGLSLLCPEAVPLSSLNWLTDRPPFVPQLLKLPCIRSRKDTNQSVNSPPPPPQASTEAGIKATPSCPMGSVLSQSGARLHLSPLLDSSDYFLSHIFPMARCLGCYPGTSPAKYEEVSSVSRPQFFVLSHSEGNHRMDSPHQITRLG